VSTHRPSPSGDPLTGAADAEHAGPAGKASPLGTGTAPPAAGAQREAAALVVVGAGAVAQVMGLAARSAASPGGALHTAGEALVVSGLLMVLGGLAWRLSPLVVASLRHRRASLAALVALVASGLLVAVVAGVALGRSASTDEPLAPVVGPGASSEATAEPVVPAGAVAGPRGVSLGQVLADQGMGFNNPPPSVPGAGFPIGSSRGASSSSPWGGATVTPASRPGESGSSTTTAALPSSAAPASIGAGEGER
jgi:hypothetical protein